MKKESILYIAGGMLIGGLLIWTYIHYFNVPSSVRMMGGGQQREKAMMGVGIDKHFIEQMIPHHDGAIEMATLAKERSKRSEILTLSEAIIQSQTKENEQMRAWYREWYGLDVAVDQNVHMGMGRGMMKGGMMGGAGDIEDLKQAEDFDTAFLKEMIPHHQLAVMMAQMLLSATERSEMKQLAEDIIKAQEAEIEQMRIWLSDGI